MRREGGKLLIFKEWGAGVSILIALVLAIITVIKTYKDYKRAIELQTPVFVIEKMQSFGTAKYTLLIRNINDNYFVIKKVRSSDSRAECEYVGVFGIDVKRKKDGEVIKESYKGHNIEVFINSPEVFETHFEIEGITFSNRKFIVCTLDIKFKNHLKQTDSVQDRYLEFIKK